MSVRDAGLSGLLKTAERCYNQLFDEHGETKKADGGSVFESGPLDPVERADGDAYFSEMLQTALQLVDVDPAMPAFQLPFQSELTRHMDNGAGSVYGMVYVDQKHRYRLRGRRADEAYLAVTLYADDTGQPDRTVWAANHREIPVERNGTFELELTPSDGAVWLNTRQYFHDPENDAHGSFQIEVLDGPPSERGTGAAMAAGWEHASRYLEAVTGPATIWDPPPPWVSLVPNTMGDPSGWQVDARAAKDQLYASGTFDLGEDEMLVMQTVWPTCAYASATVWNRFSQSVDRRLHRSSLNDRNSSPQGDGTVQLVVARRNPGVPNWLDTGGRRRGTIFWRFLLPDGPLHPIHCRVARFGDL